MHSSHGTLRRNKNTAGKKLIYAICESCRPRDTRIQAEKSEHEFLVLYTMGSVYAVHRRSILLFVISSEFRNRAMVVYRNQQRKDFLCARLTPTKRRNLEWNRVNGTPSPFRLDSAVSKRTSNKYTLYTLAPIYVLNLKKMRMAKRCCSPGRNYHNSLRVSDWVRKKVRKDIKKWRKIASRPDFGSHKSTAQLDTQRLIHSWILQILVSISLRIFSITSRYNSRRSLLTEFFSLCSKGAVSIVRGKQSQKRLTKIPHVSSVLLRADVAHIFIRHYRSVRRY